MLKYYQATHVGLVRKQNEDSLAIIEPDTFVVADGMGGQAAGEVASQMLISIVRDKLTSTPLPWNEDVLRSAIYQANKDILNEARQKPQYEGMGTTATILHAAEPKESQPQITTQTAYYAHVGDSRLYKLKNGTLEQITQDHSYVESLVRKGELTEAEARVHPMKNILTQAVGAIEDLTIDVGRFNINAGDVFLLCTDGLTNMVEDDDIAKILRSSQNPADDLINAALEHGGKDNVTAIVFGVL